MHKVAILGANGQVGAELCLLLARSPGIDLVPVCRNPTGSAFLRYSGIACRHGLPGDPHEAPSLFGDCDAIVNLALGTGTPAAVRRFDQALMRNMFRHSKPDAVIIHCSTLMVHGDPRPGRLLRSRDGYGRAKFFAERCVRVSAKRAGRTAYILRLGHVCGPLQNITRRIQSEIRLGEALLPEQDLPSNTVFTVTIADAITSILAGRERPGAYDLTNSPQWTWRQVYEHESRVLGCHFDARTAATPQPPGLRRMAARWLRRGGVRRAADRWLALAPAALNERAQAAWLKMRAAADIAALDAATVPAPEFSWIRLDHRPLSALRPTASLLACNPYEGLIAPARGRWPQDLQPAMTLPTELVQQQSS